MLTVTADDVDVDGREGVDGFVLYEDPPLPHPHAARTTSEIASIRDRMTVALRKRNAERNPKNDVELGDMSLTEAVRIYVSRRYLAR